MNAGSPASPDPTSKMGADVRMIQRRCGPGFFVEAADAASIGRPCGRQDLERHIPPKTGITSAIHLAHAPGANQADDLVGAQPGAWNQLHLLWRRDCNVENRCGGGNSLIGRFR